MKKHIIIPARFDSVRFPGKALADIAGKPMIQHVYEQGLKAEMDSVIVATDDERIQKAVEAFGGEVCMTSSTHRSGTERIAEVIEKRDIDDDDIVVNLQGDEPMIPPALLAQVADNLEVRPDVPMATLSEPIFSRQEIFNTDYVKVITDKDGYAIYFSRAPIPWYRDGFSKEDIEKPQHYIYQWHIGIYAYRAEFVRRYVSWMPSPIEKVESLEQLRVLWYGEKIHVDTACEQSPVDINTPEDLEKMLSLFE